MSDKPTQSDECNGSHPSAGCAEQVKIFEHEVQQIKRLKTKNRWTVLTELILLKHRNFQQQLHIDNLANNLKKSTDEKESIQQLLLSKEQHQPSLETMYETLKLQSEALALQFEEKNQKIATYVEETRLTRLKERNDVITDQVNLGDIKKRFTALEDKALQQTNEYRTLLNNIQKLKRCITELEKEIETLSGGVNKLATEYASLKTERQLSKSKRSNDLAEKMQYEHEQMKCIISDKHETISKLKFLQEKAAEDLKKIKLKNEPNMNNLRKELVDVEEETKKLIDEKQHACDAISKLRESIQIEENEIRALQEKTSIVEKNAAKLDEDIKTAKIRINSMEEQLKELKKESTTTGITITPAPKRLQFSPSKKIKFVST